MIVKYALVLSGDNPELPFKEDAHTFARRGQTALLVTETERHLVLVPSREKCTVVFGPRVTDLAKSVEATDNSRGIYREVLTGLKLQYPTYVLDTTSTHSPHRCVSISADVEVLGLVDTKVKATYLVVADTNTLQEILDKEPLRYYVYRFPKPTQPLMLHTEILCSKWHRWRKDMDVLGAFNALERRLYK